MPPTKGGFLLFADMRLRQLVGSIIIHGDKILLQKRPEDGRLFGGFWTFAGGHMEHGEHNNADVTCLREVHEETGFTDEDIKFMYLKYVTARRKKDEIRMMYIYVLHMKAQKAPWVTDEGAFYWHDISEIPHLKFSFVTEQVLKHYLSQGYKDMIVMEGSVQLREQEPHLQWHPIHQWDESK